jgi:4-aminobutyrate aminotransferase
LATIDLLEKKLVANAATVGKYVHRELEQFKTRHRLIGDVRGMGLMIGLECVRDRETKEMAVQERNEIIQRCFRKGLLLLGAGQNVIRIVPPLMVTRKDADVALDILDGVLLDVEGDSEARRG